MKYNKENPLRLFEVCAGYGSQCLALNRLREAYPDFDYELVAWAEYDPTSKAATEKQPAVVAHNALFPQWADRNLGDITKIDWGGKALSVTYLRIQHRVRAFQRLGCNTGSPRAAAPSPWRAYGRGGGTSAAR